MVRQIIGMLKVLLGITAVMTAITAPLVHAQCFPAGQIVDNDPVYSCDNPVDLVVDVTANLPDYLYLNPVVYYEFENNYCGGKVTHSTIQIFQNATCISSTTGNTIFSSVCSSNRSQVILFEGNLNQASHCIGDDPDLDMSFDAGYCNWGGGTSFVYLCPGDLTIPCVPQNGTQYYRNFYILECTPQTIFTGAPIALSQATQPQVDISSVKDCNVYYPDGFVRSGFTAITPTNETSCCKQRGIVQEGTCISYNCFGSKIIEEFFYQFSTSTDDGQICFYDCDALGEVNPFAEYITNYQGPVWYGPPQPYNPFSTLPINITSVYVTINITNAHEVAYYVVPYYNTTFQPDAKPVLELDEYGNQDYGCRYRGVYDGTNCVVTGGCGGASVKYYSVGFLYDEASLNCFSECHTAGIQFHYPFVVPYIYPDDAGE